MRSIERIFLILLTAFVLALTPLVAMADNTSSGTELDHSDYGMDGWIDSFDTDSSMPGIQIEGDGAYGYYTGKNPGFKDSSIYGDTGEGEMFRDYTNWTSSVGTNPYGAPSYTTPCPDITYLNNDPQGDEFGDADCKANTDTSDPQTEPVGTNVTGNWDIPILDDVLAKMWDFTADNDRLTQTLDILFFLDPTRKVSKTASSGAGDENAFIDQTLDQDLADYQGNIDSFVGSNGVGSNGVGIVNRLVQIYGLSNSVMKNGTGGALEGYLSGWGENGSGDDADYIEQWVLSYTKDVAGNDDVRLGIVSSYSGWFSLDKNVRPTCPDGTVSENYACDYKFKTGHAEVKKDVPEVDGHPNDDVPPTP